MYRLLAIDLDGTLLTPPPQKHITARTHLALRQAAEVGVTLVIATGQNLAVLQNTCGDLPLQGPQIIENGAVLTDLEGQIYQEQLVPPQYMLPALDLLRAVGLYRAYHTIHRVYVDRQTPRAQDWYRPPAPLVIEVEDVASLFPLSCVKIVGIGPEALIRARREDWTQQFAGKHSVTQTSFDERAAAYPRLQAWVRRPNA